jgi:hypothetical protein
MVYLAEPPRGEDMVKAAHAEDILEVLESGESRGAWFFRRSPRSNIVVSGVIAAILVPVWVSRLQVDLTVSALFELLIVPSVAFFLRKNPAKLVFDFATEPTTVRYTRPGMSWMNIIQAQLGCALVFTMAYFLFANIMSDSRFLTDVSSLLAAAIILALFPVLPLVAHQEKLPMLKTSFSVQVDESGLPARGQMRMTISVLELAWAGKEQDFDLQESIVARLTDLMTNHAGLLTSSAFAATADPSGEV